MSKDPLSESSGENSLTMKVFEKHLSKNQNFKRVSPTMSPTPLSPVDLGAFDRVVGEARICLERKKRAEKTLLKEQEAFIDKMRELDGFAKYNSSDKIKKLLNKYEQ